MDTDKNMEKSVRRLALLAGINQYTAEAVPAIDPLHGCVNDVTLFRDLITSKFGFAAADVLMLTDEQATRAAIVDGFKTHLAGQAKAGDVVVFYYSGHGSQIPDPPPSTVIRTSIVPHDSRDPANKVFDITMDDLNELLDEVRAKTSNITVICDSCFSGNLVRGRVTRSIEADKRKQPHRARPEAVGLTVNTGIAFISGCQANQFSSEDTLDDGMPHGAMSFFLNKYLRQNTNGVTWRDVIDAVTGEVQTRFPPQTPELKSDVANHLLFGGAGAVADPYFLTGFSDEEKIAVVSAGLIHGLTVGAQLDTYAPNTLVFTGAPLGRIEVTDLTPTSAQATVVSGGGIVNGCRSILRVSKPAAPSLRVFFDLEGAGPAMAGIQTRVTANPKVQVVSARANCDLAIRQADGKILLETADRSELSPGVPAHVADVVDGIGNDVENWAQWFALLKLTDSGLDGKVTVAIALNPAMSNADGSVRPTTDGKTLGLTITVTHDFKGPMFISLLDLSDDGSVAVVQRNGDRDTVPAGMEAPAVFKVGLTLPARKTAGLEVFKAFATTTHVDLSGLVRGAIVDPLAAATRGASPVPDGAWATGLARVRVSVGDVIKK